MANQEGVKIVITAEDKFTETIKKIDAHTAIFGETAKNVERKMAALEKEMVRLVANGLTPADKKIVEMKANYDKLKQSLDTGEGSLKKSGQQWTNLALVIQDLPYGFRGIQNNLPALIGGIAGVGGAAYLAFSAIIALYTAYGEQINDAIFKTTNLEKAQKELTKSTLEAAKSTADERKELLEVAAVIQAAKQGFLNQGDAVQYFNDKVGDSIGKVGSLAEAEQALTDKAPKYIEALMLKAKAEYYFAKASEFAVKKDIANLEDQTSALDKLLVLSKTIGKFADVTGVKSIIGTLVTGIGEAQREGVSKVQKTAGAIADVLNTEGQKAMSAYFEALKKSGLTDAEIKAIIDRQNKIIQKAQEEANKERLNAINKANDAEVNAYIKTLDERGQKEYKAGIDLADNLEKMRAAGYSDSTTYYAAYRAEMDKIAEYYNNKEAEDARKKSEKIAKDAEAADNRQLQNSLDALKIQSDVAMKIANSTGKATSSERIAILQKYKNALYDLASIGGWTEEQFDKITDALVRVDGAIEGSKDNLKDYKVSWTDTMNTINRAVLDFVVNSVTSLGESLGKALAGEKVQPLVAIGELLAEALSQIGKALITFAITQKLALEALKNPFAWPVALAAGFAAVTAGAFLKSSLNKDKTKKFANGGIVSGPTFGLMGEYPGASSNPEVVAPLDKLKEMIGGGNGGTFVLRGQDLLLSVNRAQKASNIKGQNISLA